MRGVSVLGRFTRTANLVADRGVNWDGTKSGHFVLLRALSALHYEANRAPDFVYSDPCFQNYLLMSSLASRRLVNPSSALLIWSGAAAEASFISFTAVSKSPLATAIRAASLWAVQWFGFFLMLVRKTSNARSCLPSI